MKFSISLSTGFEGVMYPIPFVEPGDLVRLARLCEKLGYDSVWGNDHITSQHYARAVPRQGVGAYREEFAARAPRVAPRCTPTQADPFALWVGGHNMETVERAARLATGWLSGWRPWPELDERIRKLKARAAELGRDPAAEIEIGLKRIGVDHACA